MSKTEPSTVIWWPETAGIAGNRRNSRSATVTFSAEIRAPPIEPPQNTTTGMTRRRRRACLCPDSTVGWPEEEETGGGRIGRRGRKVGGEERERAG